MALNIDMIGGSEVHEEAREDKEFAILVSYIQQNFPKETGVQIGKVGEACKDGHRVGRYSDLHVLRGLAITLENQGLAAVARMTEDQFGEAAESFYTSGSSATRYPHLVNHQDDRGYYVPFELPEPLAITGTLVGRSEPVLVTVGSSKALLRELDELNDVLKMPGDAGDLAEGNFDKITSAHTWPIGAHVWGVLHLYARESAERYVFIRFC
jgi:hypothetical protein